MKGIVQQSAPAELCRPAWKGLETRRPGDRTSVSRALTIPRRPCHGDRYEPGRPSDDTLTARPFGSGKFNRLRPARLQAPLPGSPSARFPH
jgi:hypothetical protein